MLKEFTGSNLDEVTTFLSGTGVQVTQDSMGFVELASRETLLRIFKDDTIEVLDDSVIVIKPSYVGGRVCLA